MQEILLNAIKSEDFKQLLLNINQANVELEMVKNLLQPQIDNIFKQTLNEYNIVDEDIKSENDCYLLEDEVFQKYLQEKHEMILKNGFVVEFGYCPILIAKNKTKENYRAVVDYLHNIEPSLGFDKLFYNLDVYKKFCVLTDNLVEGLLNQKRK